jgi:N-acetylglucosaminyldiphosphoundecaprenol N-acetyl-beta-D-mannosaminyltransferase
VKASPTPEALDILGISLQPMTFRGALTTFLDAARARAAGSLRVHFLTVHTVVESQGNPALRSILNSAGSFVATDGMPLVWLARLHGAREARRVCGPDMMLAVVSRGREYGLRHYFYGGAEGVPEELARRLIGRYPGLEVVGTYSPFFRQLSAEEDANVVRRINDARPDVVWVGLGSPKQEFWVAEHQGRLDAPLLLAVGAAFDFHSGTVKRAPPLLQRTGLEWLYRLAAEPRRLWRRYTVTNLKFGWLVATDFVRSRARPKATRCG